ncbi:hypothetical protein PMAYCL1PPCAC_11750, partial [Pristionchus mayeri]
PRRSSGGHLGGAGALLASRLIQDIGRTFVQRGRRRQRHWWVQGRRRSMHLTRCARRQRGSCRVHLSGPSSFQIEDRRCDSVHIHLKHRSVAG